jgi:CDP-4-dehydro-6-deoxyglucose reductase
MPTVTVQPGNDQVRISEGQTILEGLFKAGYAYRVGCRRGGCGVCKVDLVDGTVVYDHTIADTVLTPEERQTSTCLSCRAVPQGDVTISLREDELRCTNPFLVLINRARSAPGRPMKQSETRTTS